MSKKYLITGATGQLGRLVIETMRKKSPDATIIAAVRNPAKAAPLAELGVEIREADYEKPETLRRALQGVDHVLLISSSEIGKRAQQHRNVIAAAQDAHVSRIVYTSVLHADTSVLGLAEEHRQTEAALVASGIPSVILRNGWYTENYLAAVPTALEYGALTGCAGEGRISSASRQDYAEAAVAVLLDEELQADNTIFELGGDDAYSLLEFAEALSALAQKNVVYNNVSQEEYATVLQNAGFPTPVAQLLADSDTGASNGALFDDSHTLSHLIGRPTTSLRDAIQTALDA